MLGCQEKTSGPAVRGLGRWGLEDAQLALALGGSGRRGGWSGRGSSGGRSTTVAARSLTAGRPVAANPPAADLAGGLAAARLAATNLLHLAAGLAAARLAGGGAGGRRSFGRLTARRSTRFARAHLAATDLLYLAARLAGSRGAGRWSACRRGTNGRLATRRGTGAMEQARLGRGAKQQNQGTGSHQREDNATVHGHTPHGKNGRLPTLGSWIGFHTINLQQLSAVPAAFFWPVCLAWAPSVASPAGYAGFAYGAKTAGFPNRPSEYPFPCPFGPYHPLA